MRSIFSIIAA